MSININNINDEQQPEEEEVLDINNLEIDHEDPYEKALYQQFLVRTTGFDQSGIPTEYIECLGFYWDSLDFLFPNPPADRSMFDFLYNFQMKHIELQQKFFKEALKRDSNKRLRRYPNFCPYCDAARKMEVIIGRELYSLSEKEIEKNKKCFYIVNMLLNYNPIFCEKNDSYNKAQIRMRINSTSTANLKPTDQQLLFQLFLILHCLFSASSTPSPHQKTMLNEVLGRIGSTDVEEEEREIRDFVLGSVQLVLDRTIDQKNEKIRKAAESFAKKIVKNSPTNWSEDELKAFDRMKLNEVSTKHIQMELFNKLRERVIEHANAREEEKRNGASASEDEDDEEDEEDEDEYDGLFDPDDIDDEDYVDDLEEEDDESEDGSEDFVDEGEDEDEDEKED